MHSKKLNENGYNNTTEIVISRRNEIDINIYDLKIDLQSFLDKLLKE